MRLALAAVAVVVASPAVAVEPLTLPPISASPAIPNAARGWWVVVAMGPGYNGGVSEMAQREFAAGVKSATSACGFATFEEVSSLFTGFPERYAFPVFAVGGYPSRATAECVLMKIKPCMPNAYLKSMSLQSE